METLVLLALLSGGASAFVGVSRKQALVLRPSRSSGGSIVAYGFGGHLQPWSLFGAGVIVLPYHHGKLRPFGPSALLQGGTKYYSTSAASEPEPAAVATAAAPGMTALPAPDSPSMRLVAGFAFNAGWTNIVVLKKYGAFPTMMTGNAMKMTGAAVACRWGDVAYFATIIMGYVVGAAAYRITVAVAAAMSTTRKRKMTAPRALAPVVLVLFTLCDVLAPGEATRRTIAVPLLAVAFGMINGVCFFTQQTITNMLTVHLHRLTHFGVDTALGGAPVLGPADRRSMAVLGAFVGGAALGVTIAAEAPRFLACGCFTALGVAYAAMLGAQDDAGRLALQGTGTVRPIQTAD